MARTRQAYKRMGKVMWATTVPKEHRKLIWPEDTSWPGFPMFMENDELIPSQQVLAVCDAYEAWIDTLMLRLNCYAATHDTMEKQLQPAWQQNYFWKKFWERQEADEQEAAEVGTMNVNNKRVKREPIKTCKAYMTRSTTALMK